MRARGIKPRLFKNELLGPADPLYTVIFCGLWCLADREGRLEDRPLRIHAELAPYRPSASTGLALTWLHEHGFIDRYTANGVAYIAVRNFSKHQNPHVREPASRIPAPPNQEVTEAPGEHSASTVPAPVQHQSGPSDSGLLTPDSCKDTRARTRARGGARAPRRPGLEARRIRNPDRERTLEEIIAADARGDDLSSSELELLAEHEERTAGASAGARA